MFVQFLVKINENQIASSSGDKSIRIWDVINGICLKTLIGHFTAVYCLLKQSKNEISSGGYKLINIWDV